MKQYRITQETLASVKEELDSLINVERLKVIEEIKVARANGDLSENADYEAALNKQKEIERRIYELKDIIDNHSLLDSQKVDNKSEKSGVVKIGSKVKIVEVEDNSEYVYEILGSVDNNPQMGRISNECPLAKAILGRSPGEVVEVQHVEFPYTIKIVEIL